MGPSLGDKLPSDEQVVIIKLRIGICIAHKAQSPTQPTNGFGFGPTLRAHRPAMGLSTDLIEPIWVHNRPPLLTQQYKYANLSQLYN
ncbi:hypothetical protein ACN42_g11858 [Penicillium freii]|uniref:Uncharacterized protein n=1 Tax=Penicillium freii TaxID=48697 RepID=A0A101M7K9_PENFR|nr:hypothetical protein ACN42_g11858 [Penicillium freii]